MSNDKCSQEVVIRNEDVAAESFISLHGYEIEYSKKQDIVTNI